MLKQIIVRHIRLPLRKPIKHASHERLDTDNILVECHLANGMVGFGEGVPREYVTGESITSALEVLRRNSLASLQQQPSDYADAVRIFEELTLHCPLDSYDCRAIATHSVRCALELAWLDAWGQHFQQPLSTVTQIVSPELYEPRQTIQYSIAITDATGSKLIKQALAYRLYGFKQCKVKVGIRGQDDAARLRNIRRWMGSKMHLRVDANEAWKVEDVARNWNAIAQFNIAWVEQPVPHEAIDALAAVRKTIDMKVMLDESLCGMLDAEQCVAKGWGDLFNLRLSKCGGYIRTLRLASFAAMHGLQCQLGCQVGESAILSAAGRHLACSVKGLQALEGSFDRWLVTEPLGTRDLTFGRAGFAQALPGYGLGVSIDHQALERVTRHRGVVLG